jgi:hypothetical protein
LERLAALKIAASVSFANVFDFLDKPVLHNEPQSKANIASAAHLAAALAPGRGGPGAAYVAIVPQPVLGIPSGSRGLGERVTAPAAGGMGDGLELVHYRPVRWALETHSAWSRS